jgi:hypothetical protein
MVKLLNIGRIGTEPVPCLYVCLFVQTVKTSEQMHIWSGYKVQIIFVNCQSQAFHSQQFVHILRILIIMSSEEITENIDCMNCE